ncbi:8881_t:CDS:10, partial [Ambispora leptoticha]
MNNLTAAKVFLGLLLVSIITLFSTPASALIERDALFEALLKRDNEYGVDTYGVPKAQCKCVFAAATFGADNRDPNKPHGTINFFQNPCGQTSLQGEFSSGFQDTTARYEFIVKDAEGNTVQNLTSLIKLDFFNNGSVLPFKATTRKISLNCDNTAPNATSSDNNATSQNPPYGPIVVGTGIGAGGVSGGFSTTPKILNNKLFLFKNGDDYGQTAVSRNVPLVTRTGTVIRRGSNGLRTVGKNVQWLALVSFGTPPQQFELLIDTGSSNVLVTTTDCDAACRQLTESTTFFNTHKSSTFDRVSNGSYSIQFAGGTSLVYDLAVDVVTLDGLAVTQQNIGATIDIQNSVIQFGGVLGLGLEKIVQPRGFGVDTVVTTMFKQKLITKKIFAINFIKQELGGGGDITFGEYDTSLDILWLNGTSNYFWTVRLRDIFVGDRDLKVGGPFIFDTGASYIFAPCSIVERIYDSIPGSQLFVDGTWVLPCNLTDDKYDVTLQFKKENFTIPIRDFIQEPVNATGLPNDIDPTGLCIGGAQQSDSDYVLGAVFFKLFYVVFDQDHNKIVTPYQIQISYTDDELKGLQLIASAHYPNGDIILRFSTANSTSTSCYQSNLVLRLVKTDGSISKIPVNFEFPDFNFCGDSFDNGVDGIWIYPIQSILSDFIIITYFTADDTKTFSNAQVQGLLMDTNGKIYQSNYLFGPGYFPIPGQPLLNPGGIIVSSILGQGFIFLIDDNQSNGLIWTQYTAPDVNGTFARLNTQQVIQEIDRKERPKLWSVAMPTLDGGYAVIGGYNVTNATSSTYDPHFRVDVTFFRPFLNGEVDQVGPFLFFQSSVASPLPMICSSSNQGIGYICLARTPVNTTSGNSTSTKIYYQLVNYLSSGSVINIQELPLGDSTGNQANSPAKLYSLFYGGYLETFNTYNGSSVTINGYILDDNGIFKENWGFGNPLTIPAQGVSSSVLLENNTYVIFYFVNNVLNVISTDLYRFYDDRLSRNVKSVSPLPRTSINNSAQSIELTYDRNVTSSSGNITIYQVNPKVPDGTQDIPRFVCTAVKCPLNQSSINGNTLSLSVLPSTFNNPGATYYINIDSGFVKDSQLGEPIPGVQNRTWTFSFR